MRLERGLYLTGEIRVCYFTFQELAASFFARTTQQRSEADPPLSQRLTSVLPRTETLMSSCFASSLPGTARGSGAEPSVNSSAKAGASEKRLERGGDKCAP
ncbi:hypothetical protein KIL84_019734 [Mauremys mutica]|uniref:Uncharacterized protein n=1 Tax=Mauremys mutica TaxID=74926 RepID=A0A9D3XXH8_9SAUR|nr:hypothetical protein KIL84_019734 [Mauremys mutica]